MSAHPKRPHAETRTANAEVVAAARAVHHAWRTSHDGDIPTEAWRRLTRAIAALDARDES